MKWPEVPYGIVAQLAGAVVAALLVNTLYGGVAAAVNAPWADFGTALLAEVVMTAMLAFVIRAVATDERSLGHSLAPFAIGLTVLVSALWGGFISLASLNPARSFGPALVAGDFGHMLLFVVGPIVVGRCWADSCTSSRAGRVGNRREERHRLTSSGAPGGLMGRRTVKVLPCPGAL